MDWLQIGKGVRQGCILSPCLFNLHAEYTMRNAGLDEAEVDVFMEFPCFLYDPVDVGNLISVSSAFSKSSLYIWKFSVHIVLKHRILSITLIASEMSATYSSLNIVWHCPSLGLEWKLTFSGPVARAEFPKFAGILSALSQHHLLGFSIT